MTPPAHRKHFVAGPLPLDWFECAAKIGPSAVVLGILLFFKRGFGDTQICLSAEFTRRFSVSESTRRRTLRKMAAAALIKLEVRGKKTRIEILEAPANRASGQAATTGVQQP